MTEAAGRGRTGEPGRPGKTGPPGRIMSRGQTLALFLVVVFAFVVLAVRTETQARQIRAAQTRITATQAQIVLLQYEQCAARNVATRRQNTLLDSAIAAERRRPVPDAKRISDLTDFKSPLLDCGPAPDARR